jgi:hypothetical protein
MRRSKSIETLLPVLYLNGISISDFCEALAASLGKDAPMAVGNCDGSRSVGGTLKVW